MHASEWKKPDCEQPANMKYVIVTPVKNEAQFIEKTVNSVVQQTTKPTEWVIVNDGSTDETSSVSSQAGARKNPHRKTIHCYVEILFLIS